MTQWEPQQGDGICITSQPGPQGWTPFPGAEPHGQWGCLKWKATLWTAQQANWREDRSARSTTSQPRRAAGALHEAHGSRARPGGCSLTSARAAEETRLRTAVRAELCTSDHSRQARNQGQQPRQSGFLELAPNQLRGQGQVITHKCIIRG